MTVAAVWNEAGGPAMWVAVAVSVLALGPAGLRWLRVAQREHYLDGATSRFAIRWWTSEPGNVALLAVALAGVVLSARWPLCALAPTAVAVVGPLHLSLRGRTSKLVVTRRLRSLAAVWLVLQAVVVVAGVLLGAPAIFTAGGVIAVPALVDAACAVMAPVERRLSGRFVDAAENRLRRVDPVVVAITGSYGKTSTKNHVAHLLAGTRTVVATPASFNNRAGLARAINENLTDGAEVFVAEMGTYGPGEIRDLCRWCPPNLAVITAIGPVHLERFGSEDEIVRAKAEITERASTVFLNVDDARLAALADRLAGDGSGRDVVRCSAVDRAADVCVARGGRDGHGDGGGPGGGHRRPRRRRRAADEPGLRDRGRPPARRGGRAAGRPARRGAADPEPVDVGPGAVRRARHRRHVQLEPGRRPGRPGPAGRGAGQPPPGRRDARDGRARSTAAAGERGVRHRGLRRRHRLRRRRPDEPPGAAPGAAPLRPVVVRTREQAVTWVRTHLGPDDAVLYENDLPDNYP